MSGPPAPYAGSPLALGQIVEGALANGLTNAFIFTLTDETRVIFDTLTNSPNTLWRLEGPSGVLVDNQGLNASDGLTGSAVLRLASGDYQLKLWEVGTVANAYRFRLLDLGTATPITPGTPVSDALSPTTETQLYRFPATARSRYYLHFFSTNGPPSAYWRLLDPNVATIAAGYVTSAQGPVTLNLSGTYTLTVEGFYGNDSGSDR